MTRGSWRPLMQAAVRFVVRFFYDPDALTLKGVMSIVGQLAGVLAVLVSLNFLSRPATARVERLDTVACVDMAQFIAGMGASVPAKLQAALNGLSRVPPLAINWHYSVPPEGLTTDPRSVKHVIYCAYESQRSAKDAAEGAALQRAWNVEHAPPQGPADVVARGFRTAKNGPSGSTAPLRRRTNAANALDGIRDLALGGALDIWRVMRPAGNWNRFYGREPWETEHYAVGELVSVDQIVETIRSAALEPAELVGALEAFQDSRWFVHWLEVGGTSLHASAQAVVVTIPSRQTDASARRGTPSDEVLGGTVGFEQANGYWRGAIDKLLPGERRWAALRSNWRLSPDAITVVSDPMPFIDSAYVRAVLPYLAGILAWSLAVNIWARLRQRSCAPAKAARRSPKAS